MEESKTVRLDATDIYRNPLYSMQKEDVARMRTSLLSCSVNDRITSKIAMQNITVMRVYHQMARIIRYTELMDKLEEKLYESIEYAIDNLDSSRMSTWMQLISMQERLQKSMIESHKLLQPYLENSQLTVVVDGAVPKEDVDEFSLVIDQESRDKVRSSAKAVLAALSTPDSSEDTKLNDDAGDCDE